MRRLIPLAVLLLPVGPAARAGEPSCQAVAAAVRRACEEAAPPERRGTEAFQFSVDLCRTAEGVAGRACERGVHAQRYAGACGREAEYAGDVMAEACRLVLYREPRPYVKVGFKAYDERCQRHVRSAEERALRTACAPPPGRGGEAAPGKAPSR